MEQAKMRVAYVITERGDKSFWTRIGVAFTNRDGSINVRLEALPLSGVIQIRDYEPRDDIDSDARSRAVRAGIPARSLDDQHPI